MENVTLIISSTGGHSYVSDVRVFSETKNELQQIKQVTTGLSSNISLGNLDELRNSHLLIDTIAQKGNFDLNPMIEYKIRYGDTEVEHTSFVSNFNDNQFAFFSFRFRFCPRFPFC